MINVDYHTMDGGRIYHEKMAIEDYDAIAIGNIVTVYKKRYVIDKKVGHRFKGVYIREPKTLECSSKGDSRFSALYATVDVYGESRTIEAHYQFSKRFDDPNGDNFFIPVDISSAKGRKPTCFIVGGFLYPLEFLSMWYKLLWLKYLDAHPELVEYAFQYDDFSDMFKGKSTRNCQADVIRQYVKEGRQSIIDECLPLIWKMRENKKKEGF